MCEHWMSFTFDVANRSTSVGALAFGMGIASVRGGSSGSRGGGGGPPVVYGTCRLMKG